MNPICKKIDSTIGDGYFVEARTLTLDDFEIIENFDKIQEPESWRPEFRSELRVKIKEELFENLVDCLDTKSILTGLTLETTGYLYVDKERILREGRRSVTQVLKLEVKYNGCRTQEQKDQKLERKRNEFLEKLFFEKTRLIETLLNRVNEQLAGAVLRFNDDQKQQLVDLLGHGMKLNYDWLDGQCDVSSDKEEVEKLRAEIKVLDEKISKVYERINQKRMSYIERVLENETSGTPEMKDVTQRVKTLFSENKGLNHMNHRQFGRLY